LPNFDILNTIYTRDYKQLRLNAGGCNGVLEMKKISNSIKGFSLLELMITVVIIAVLAAIGLPAYDYYNKRAREVEATTALADIRAAQIIYKQDVRQGNGQYAPDLATLGWKLFSTYDKDGKEATSDWNIGRPPASFKYDTNTVYSSAKASLDGVNYVNNPEIYMKHDNPSILYTSP